MESPFNFNVMLFLCQTDIKKTRVDIQSSLKNNTRTCAGVTSVASWTGLLQGRLHMLEVSYSVSVIWCKDTVAISGLRLGGYGRRYRLLSWLYVTVVERVAQFLRMSLKFRCIRAKS